MPGQISISDFCSYYVEQQAEVFELTPTVVTDMPVADVAKLMQTKLAERTGSGANELRRSFKFFDRDSSGTIDYLEFQEAIKSLLNIYLSEDLSKKVLCHFDGDGNGEIDYQEFVQLVMKSNQEDSTSLVTNAGIASQQRGFISEHERRALRSRIVQQWKGLLTAFREADVHKSGALHSRCTKNNIAWRELRTFSKLLTRYCNYIRIPALYLQTNSTVPLCKRKLLHKKGKTPVRGIS